MPLSFPIVAGLAASLALVEASSPGDAACRAANAIPLGWLEERISVGTAERRNPGVENGDELARHPKLGKPFGALNSEWERLKARIKPGDVLWTFAAPIDSWRHHAGRTGLALVRNGCVIISITTKMN